VILYFFGMETVVIANAAVCLISDKKSTKFS